MPKKQRAVAETSDGDDSGSDSENGQKKMNKKNKNKNIVRQTGIGPP